LDVYHRALAFLVLASEIIEGLPRVRSQLSDRFSRASLSIVLNLAKGAGKHSKPDNSDRRIAVEASTPPSRTRAIQWKAIAHMESHCPPYGQGHGHVYGRS